MNCKQGDLAMVIKSGVADGIILTCEKLCEDNSFWETNHTFIYLLDGKKVFSNIIMDEVLMPLAPLTYEEKIEFLDDMMVLEKKLNSFNNVKFRNLLVAKMRIEMLQLRNEWLKENKKDEN